MEYKIAAIDLGSNGCRLQITDVINPFTRDVKFHTVDLFRLPIRLGDDVFVSEFISSLKEKALVKAMEAFKNIMEIHHVKKYRACTTSAMRDAKNAKDILNRIKQETGVDLEIINGLTEAKYIINSQDEAILDSDKYYLFMEVGGGSTQVSVFYNNEVLQSHSYQLGTVRFINNKVDIQYWKSFKKDLKKIAEKYKLSCIVGSGGNINRIHKLVVNKKEDKLIEKKVLEEVYQTLKGMTIEERVEKYKFNYDRADVIVPAAKIFVHALRCTELNTILVPKVTLLDGLIKHLYLDIVSTIDKS